MTTYAYPLSGAPMPTIVQAVAGYWEKIGVKTKIVPTDLAAFRPMRDADPPPASLMGQSSAHRSSDRPDAIGNIMYLYQSANTWRLLNNAPKQNSLPEVDQLLAAIQSEFDVTKRRALMDRLLELTVPTYVAFAVSDSPTVFGVDPKVEFDPRPAAYVASRIVYAQPKK